MADPTPETPDVPEEPQGRRVDLGKLNARMSARIGGLVQENEALQLIIEEQDEMVAALRAELVAVSSGQTSAKAGKAPARS